jgi:hypothetical protein
LKNTYNNRRCIMLFFGGFLVGNFCFVLFCFEAWYNKGTFAAYRPNIRQRPQRHRPLQQALALRHLEKNPLHVGDRVGSSVTSATGAGVGSNVSDGVGSGVVGTGT